jgi:hypothetical protein
MRFETLTTYGGDTVALVHDLVATYAAPTDETITAYGHVLATKDADKYFDFGMPVILVDHWHSVDPLAGAP